MSYEKELRALESLWLPDTGFFWRVRQGHFDPTEFEHALRTVKAISIREDSDLPRRIVSLLWYIPLFMHWQTERVRERGGDSAAFERAATAMTTEVERLLGVP
jgi:hypothetical protein